MDVSFPRIPPPPLELPMANPGKAHGFSMLINEFSHILETLFLLLLTDSLTPKTDKISTLHGTSINLRQKISIAFVFMLQEIKDLTKSN